MTQAIPSCIALTGATGFLGSHLRSALLEAGVSALRCLYRGARPTASDPRIHWVEGDLNDPFSLEELLEGASVVIHAAGLVSYRIMDKARLFEVNAHGTGHLVNAALHQGLNHFLYVSSTAALGQAPRERARDESSEWVRHSRNTPYAESKYQGELEVWRGREEGLPVSVVMPALILDRAGKQLYSRLMLDWIARGNRYYPGGGHALVDVDDVIRFILDRVKQGPCNERVILAGHHRSYRDLLADLAKAMNHPAPDRALPPGMARLFALWNKISRGMGMQPQEVNLAFTDVRVDPSLSQERYGFSYTPLDETLKAMAASWKG
jgi:dihydroflavonol-4-reductase